MKFFEQNIEAVVDSIEHDDLDLLLILEHLTEIYITRLEEGYFLIDDALHCGFLIDQ